MLCRADSSTQRPHGRAAISAALRMLCRANSSTHRPPGRTLHKKRMPHLRVTSFSYFLFQRPLPARGPRGRAGTGRLPYRVPPGRSAVPISTPSPHQHGCACCHLPVWPRARARCCPPDALPCRFQRPVPISTAALPGLPVLAAGSARADGHTCCQPDALPRRFQRPVPISTAAPAATTRFGCPPSRTC